MTEEIVEDEILEDPISIPQEPDRSEVAREVIAGKWGRGQDRRRRLTEAGYDPDSVQAAVDEIFNR